MSNTPNKQPSGAMMWVAGIIIVLAIFYGAGHYSPIMPRPLPPAVCVVGTDGICR